MIEIKRMKNLEIPFRLESVDGATVLESLGAHNRRWVRFTGYDCPEERNFPCSL